MPKYELTLREYLTGKEYDDLVACVKGEKDLMLECDELWEKMYEYYLPDMPYGTAKARTGDPVDFIIDRAGMALGIGYEK